MSVFTKTELEFEDVFDIAIYPCRYISMTMFLYEVLKNSDEFKSECMRGRPLKRTLERIWNDVFVGRCHNIYAIETSEPNLNGFKYEFYEDRKGFNLINVMFITRKI